MLSNPAIRLSIFAFHVSEIMTSPPGSRFELHPCDGVTVKVRIEKSRFVNATICDDLVYLNGECVGNRCGGRDEFAKMVNKVEPTIRYT